MKLAVIMAMALATLAAADAASAGHRQQGSIGKSAAAGGSLAAKKASPIRASTPAARGPTTQGIIMRDGGVCDPIRHMGC